MTAFPEDEDGRRRVQRARRRLDRGLPIDEAPEGLGHADVERDRDEGWPYDDEELRAPQHDDRRRNRRPM